MTSEIVKTVTKWMMMMRDKKEIRENNFMTIKVWDSPEQTAQCNSSNLKLEASFATRYLAGLTVKTTQLVEIYFTIRTKVQAMDMPQLCYQKDLACYLKVHACRKYIQMEV
jgi:hypothetical protein